MATALALISLVLHILPGAEIHALDAGSKQVRCGHALPDSAYFFAQGVFTSHPIANSYNLHIY